MYNADETGIYFRATPDRTHTFAHEPPSGGKKSKERITAMVCSNMDGTDKRKLLIIGKSKAPRCFKNCGELPVDYHANSNAWMTSEIYTTWLRSWDKELKRKILVLVDNCPAHPKVPGLKNITVEFLPPNTTSIIQPMDQGIIKNLKTYYRKQLCERLISLIDSQDPSTEAPLPFDKLAIKNVTLLNAITMLAIAWNSVTQPTLQNCFRKGGFTEPGRPMIRLDNLPMIRIEAPTGFNQEAFDNFELETENIAVTEGNDDESIIQAARETIITPSEPDQDDADEISTPKLPTTELIKSLTLMREQFEMHGLLDCVENMNKTINSLCAQQKLKQTTIDDFFKYNCHS